MNGTQKTVSSQLRSFSNTGKKYELDKITKNGSNSNNNLGYGSSSQEKNSFKGMFFFGE
jgi:hypothetical protein